MNRQQIDQLCAKGIFGVVLAILLFGPLAMGAVRGEDIAVLGGLATLGAALWLVRVWLTPGYRLAWPPMCLAVLAFLVLALYRYPDATVEYAARGEVLRILIYALVFFVVLNNAAHRWVGWVSYVIVGLGVFMSLYAIYQFMTHSNLVWNLVRPENYIGRGSGTYICPNHLAGYLELAIPIGLAHLFMGRLKPQGRVVISYAVLAMLAGLGATVSRGGWIAAALGLLLFFGIIVLRRGTRWPAVVMFALVLAGGLWFAASSSLAQRRLDQTTLEGRLDDVRLHIWRQAKEIWLDHLWLGAGPAQFDSLFRRYRPPEVQMRALYVHNDYLNTLCDWGVVGFLIVAAFFAAFGFTAIRVWRAVQRKGDDLAERNSNRSAFALAVITGTFSLLVHSFVDFNFQIPANAILVIALAAMVCGVGFVSGHVGGLRLNNFGKAGLTLVVLLVCGFVAPESVVKYREGWRLTRSNYRDLPAVDEMRLLREMAEIEPMNPETAYRLGEVLRLLNWEKPPGYYGRIVEAKEWFEKAIRLNPNDAYNHVRLGMCQDLLREYAAATETFERAAALDRNGAVTMANVGWHYLQIDEYQLAKKYLERSISLNWWDNTLAREQLEIVAMFLPVEEK